MPSGTLAKRVTRVYSAEQWAEARRLYEDGLSLEGVAEKLGMPYSTIQNHAWVESWPVRSRGGQRDPRYQAAKARQIRRKLEKEEKRLEQELALVKTEDLELLARRSLAADSARAKVAVSRLVTKFVSRLEDPSVPVWSAAQALGSLAPIFRLVWGWGDREADMQRMKRAVTSYADAEPAENPTGAVNLRLINTTPAQLAEMAKAQFDLDEHSGPSATEPNGQGVGPSAIATQQARKSPPVGQVPKEETPIAAVKEPAPPSRTLTKERVAPPSTPEQLVQGDHASSPAAQAQEARLAALAKARTEHRKASWERYREKGR